MAQFRLIIALVSLSFISCKSKEILTPYQETRIVLGEFGGFAGSYNEIVILTNGQTFRKKSFKGEYMVQEDIDVKMITQSIATLEKVSHSDASIQDSGNMSYFIKYEKSGKKIVDALWGGMNQKPSPILRQVHKNLKSLCQEQKIVM